MMAYSIKLLDYGGNCFLKASSFREFKQKINYTTTLKKLKNLNYTINEFIWTLSHKNNKYLFEFTDDHVKIRSMDNTLQFEGSSFLIDKMLKQR